MRINLNVDGNGAFMCRIRKISSLDKLVFEYIVVLQSSLRTSDHINQPETLS